MYQYQFNWAYLERILCLCCSRLPVNGGKTDLQKLEFKNLILAIPKNQCYENYSQILRFFFPLQVGFFPSECVEIIGVKVAPRPGQTETKPGKYLLHTLTTYSTSILQRWGFSHIDRSVK